MTYFAAITNVGIFAGTSLLGAEILQMDSVIAVSVGFLVVMLKVSFEMGRLVRRMEDWSRDMDAWRMGITRWQEKIENRLEQHCQRVQDKHRRDQ